MANCWIKQVRAGNSKDPAAWDDLHTWLKECAEAFHVVFGPRIKQLALLCPFPKVMSASVPVVLKSGDERFYEQGKTLAFDLRQFWQWSASDLLNNRMRGLLAEYLVVQAVGDPSQGRLEWDTFDVVTSQGLRIEVKSAAYVQGWHQTKPSTIRFDIRPTRAWDAATKRYADRAIRQADVYVFCLLGQKDSRSVDPLDVAQWRFFVLETARLDKAVGTQKTIGLRSLLALGAEEVPYASLAARVGGLSLTMRDHKG